MFEAFPYLYAGSLAWPPRLVGELAGALSERMRATPQWHELSAKLAALGSTSVGKPAPGFTMRNAAGRNVSLKDFRGRWVLVQFWASWCPHCRAEAPALVELYTRFAGSDFEMVGVALDRSRADWLAQIEAGGRTWPQLSDLKGWDSQVAKLYGVSAIPANFLIDPQGRIVAVNLRGAALTDALAGVLK
ncbi:MAG: TlpA family protein disulfide reductase [Rikenellaceae bacterium]|nr:TlpA family protein disulfide reductase [Rikenellaceae bacterium]